MNGEGILEQINFSLRFRDVNSSFCFTPFESIVNGTAKNVDAVNFSLPFMLCDRDKRKCQGENWNMKMYASWNAYQYSLWVVVMFIGSVLNVYSKRSCIVHI